MCVLGAGWGGGLVGLGYDKMGGVPGSWEFLTFFLSGIINTYNRCHTNILRFPLFVSIFVKNTTT